MAPITHIVAFNAPAEHQQSLAKGFLALKDECKRDGRAYITSIKAGKQVSPEGRDYETTLVFVLEFKTREDIDYYIDHDPAHQSFKDAIPGWGIKGAVVLDFVDGEF